MSARPTRAGGGGALITHPLYVLTSIALTTHRLYVLTSIALTTHPLYVLTRRLHGGKMHIDAWTGRADETGIECALCTQGRRHASGSGRWLRVGPCSGRQG